MEKTKSKLIIHEEDYQLLLQLLSSGDDKAAYDRKNAEDLKNELAAATIIVNEKFPPAVIRLNSRILVREERSGRLLEFTIVTPRRANIAERKISVLAPLGTALIGFQKGDRVKWEMPAGSKYFRILEVSNG